MWNEWLSLFVTILGSLVVGVWAWWSSSQEAGNSQSPEATGIAFGIIAFVIIFYLTEAIAVWLRSI